MQDQFVKLNNQPAPNVIITSFCLVQNIFKRKKVNIKSYKSIIIHYHSVHLHTVALSQITFF